ncbi:oxidase [Pseudomonas sp. S75]|uniref:oxidase n=1 Tax=unclassified Pseudomonas TaxID=196821 RepID=UPI0019075A65|nr:MULTISPECIES: oxidase [unclassified Pseudomonas]MBJ9975681.1 oxidase [Pseudomonas sp. S30]MBK0153232.1 oxidase [Pseudomonas sp. S75]
MSILSVFHSDSPLHPYKVLTHYEDIVATLAEQGMELSKRAQIQPLCPGEGEQSVMHDVQEMIDSMRIEEGAVAWDLLDHASDQPVTGRWHEEHVHEAQETLTVAAGRAQVSVRIGELIYSVLCERGDSLRIPARARRWIDLGDRPHCLAIRIYRSGQAPVFTGDETCRELPGMSEL